MGRGKAKPKVLIPPPLSENKISAHMAYTLVSALKGDVEAKEKEIEKLKAENLRLSNALADAKAEKDNFAIAFAVWLTGTEGQMYKASGISALAVLNKYKDRSYIDAFNPSKQ